MLKTYKKALETDLKSKKRKCTGRCDRCEGSVTKTVKETQENGIEIERKEVRYICKCYLVEQIGFYCSECGKCLPG